MNTDNTNKVTGNPSSNLNSNSSNTNNNNNTNNNGGGNANSQPPPLRCPRCDSPNTKFCYYNNYSLLQPRYFCKSCRRYWTKGGALRNVPVGGGCRKNKRVTSRQRIGGVGSASDLISGSPSASFLSHPHLVEHHHASPFPPFTDLHLPPRPSSSLTLLSHGHDHAANPNLLYFNLPSNEALMKDNAFLNQQLLQSSPSASMAGPHPELHPHSVPTGLFSRQLASYLPSSLASQYLSNVGSLPLQNMQSAFSHAYVPGDASASLAPHERHQFIQHGPFSSTSNSSMHLRDDPSGSGGTVPKTTSSSIGASHHEQSNLGFKGFSLPFDNLNTGNNHHQHQQQQQAEQVSTGHWATNKLIPLLTDKKLTHANKQAIEDQTEMEGSSRIYPHLRPPLHSPKVEEGWTVAPSHQHEPTGVSSGDQATANYWNISGGWNEVPGYNNPEKPEVWKKSKSTKGRLFSAL
ncbi:hypothetical protein KP509_12G042700 [Ceratopteris richardii]|uniref:Dof-type domain-containing protein n=1 Tax=Ceratopteris richardii TaxID=49495 RepID=A0A8T2TP26_CERRI|nr:hypothetical protein KP509_12G042700 [Ceratopteris richardii]